MQLGVHEAPLYHEHEHMYHQLMPADSRRRLLRFPIPVEFDRQRHSCNLSAGICPAVYDFLRARTTTTASTPHLQALEVTVATTSQPAQALGLRSADTLTFTISMHLSVHPTIRDDGWVDLVKVLPLPLFGRASAADIKTVVKESFSTNKARFKYVAWQGDSVAVI